MLSDLDTEGIFKRPTPIILYHWDLEPCNVMVSNTNTNTTYAITGIIDWDKALALPLPLSWIPPRWIWHVTDETLNGYLNDD